MMSIFTTEKFSMDKMKKPKLGAFPARSLLTAPHFGFSPKGFVSEGGMAEAGLTEELTGGLVSVSVILGWGVEEIPRVLVMINIKSSFPWRLGCLPCSKQSLFRIRNLDVSLLEKSVECRLKSH